ncbi:NAD(P)-dependent oxidoreductase [Streptomyces durbertensis]|uniref:NAD(P)-dependent oxidoreductase n=1 Tax=Streptomyces durbertensis TaxID=2448886 RepID=A0ABR6ECV6_9ACTN|nr:NAD(P)-dependent oxidoreductase [Streptomyces durbertensis]MBB1243013.1 NAD(P)-dependent oxidoreductase [Streptomyces durbertensis]
MEPDTGHPPASGPRAPGGVLVLGGSGFVGRHVCAAFAARGHRVLSVSRRPGPDGAVRTVALDLSRPGGLPELLAAERPSHVVNCVGSIWGRSDAEMSAACLLPTERLLAALAEAGTPRPGLVHLGSVMEYGPVPTGGTAGGTARPTTAYGRAKLAATEAVLRADPEAVVLRVANVSGPGTPPVSLLGRVAAQLAGHLGGGPGAPPRRRPARVTLTPLAAHRDYVDARDVADAVVAAAVAEPGAVAGRVLDLGRGVAVPVRELVELLIEVSGVPAELVETAPPPAGGAPGPALDWLRVDPRPARDALGWHPRRSLKESLVDFWAEHRAHAAR